MLVIYGEIFKNIRLSLFCDLTADSEFAIFKKDKQPVQNVVAAASQRENRKLRQIQLVLIGKPVWVIGASPFLRQLHAFRAVEAQTVIIIWVSNPESRAFNDFGWTVIDSDFFQYMRLPKTIVVTIVYAW